MTENNQVFDWERKAFERAQEKAKKRADEAKKAILSKTESLQSEGVDYVICEFSGYDNDGDIQLVKYFSNKPHNTDDETLIPENDIPKTAQPDIEDFYSLLPLGFKENEGSSGTISWNLSSGKIVLSIDWNVVKTENETREV